MFRKLTHSAVAAALLVLSHTPATADDAEIYVNQSVTEVGNPAVMFSLDLRSNLNSQVCNNWAQCYPLFERAGMLAELGSTGPGDGPGSVTFFQLLRGALKVVLAPVEDVYIGLMLNNENRNNCEGGERQRCANGGYVAMDFQLLSVDTTTGNSDPVKDAFDGMLKSIPPPQENAFGNYSHTYQGRELFFELWRYLQGRRVYNGWNGFRSFDGNAGDDRTNIANEALHSDRWTAVAAELDSAGKGAAAQLLRDMNGFAPDPRAAPGGVVGNRTYRDPTYLGVCAQIYTINFLFQVSQQEADSDAAIAADIPVLASRRDFEDIIEYMNRTDLAGTVSGDQKVVSYFFGDPRFTGGDGRKLDGYAQAGGTGYARELSEDPDQLVADLQNIFDQILSVSTTFTAAALPINSFDRAQLREDVFLALFQPQNNAFPADNRYWWGNVKKLRLPGLNSAADNIELVDANGDPAIAADGRIERNRLTFWTNSAAPDVMDPTRDPDELARAGFDGRSANRGGAGHRVPTFPQTGVAVDAGPRTVYYDTAGGALAELDTTAPVVTALTAEFEVANPADTTALIHYISGRDPANPTVPLDWLMGSVIHSRPLPINYGALDDGSLAGHDRDNPLLYIAVGSNDGLLRFIRNTAPGNATDNTTDLSIHLGKEVWAFAPRATMRNARRIFLSQGDSPGALGETTVYGVDGPPVAWLEDLNGDGTITDSDRAYLFFGLRRGGRAYYALDVSSPEAPELLWSIDAEEDAAFAELGLTFSEPSIGRLDIDNDGDGELVLVFAGGYDRRYDDENWNPSDAPASEPLLGNAIYIVNAETGHLVRRLKRTGTNGMNDSIPSAPTVVDTNGDDLIDRIYVGDMGGKIWRVDMPRSTLPAAWPISLFANLGRQGVGSNAVGGADDRRFFHKPDVVQAGVFRDASGAVIAAAFDAVVIASGDRASPLTTGTQNWAFTLRDSNLGILSEQTDTDIQLDDLMEVTTAAAAVTDAYKGWRLELEASGEKGLSTPLTIGNVVFFTTFVPPGAAPGDAAVCGPAEGSGRLYRVSLFNANPLRDGPINPWDTEEAPRYVDLRSGGIPAEVVALPPNRILRPDLDVEPVPVTARWRTFWHLDEEPLE